MRPSMWANRKKPRTPCIIVLVEDAISPAAPRLRMYNSTRYENASNGPCAPRTRRPSSPRLRGRLTRRRASSSQGPRVLATQPSTPSTGTVGINPRHWAPAKRRGVTQGLEPRSQHASNDVARGPLARLSREDACPRPAPSRSGAGDGRSQAVAASTPVRRGHGRCPTPLCASASRHHMRRLKQRAASRT